MDRGSFANWQELARQGKADFFFQNFRPDGFELVELLKGVAGSSEIVPRLLEVYEATAESHNTAQHEDPYFVVRNPTPASDDELRSLTRRHYIELNGLASVSGAIQLPAVQELFEITILRSRVPNQLATDPEVLFQETINDLVFSMTPIESDFLLLEEAFYHINCDYFLRHYLLWPLYRQASVPSDPFRPYFDLWKRAARPALSEPTTVQVYVLDNS